MLTVLRSVPESWGAMLHTLLVSDPVRACLLTGVQRGVSLHVYVGGPTPLTLTFWWHPPCSQEAGSSFLQPCVHLHACGHLQCICC